MTHMDRAYSGFTGRFVTFFLVLSPLSLDFDSLGFYEVDFLTLGEVRCNLDFEKFSTEEN